MSNAEKSEMVPKWRLDAMRKATSEALVYLAELARHQEEGGFIEDYEVYPRLVKAIALLANGLNSGVEL